MVMLKNPVGPGCVNSRTDVVLIQHLINGDLPMPLRPLDEDGIAGSKTYFAIQTYQQRLNLVPTGRIDPNSPTFQALVRATGSSTGPGNPSFTVTPPPPSSSGPIGARFSFDQFWQFTDPLEGGTAYHMFMVNDLQVATGMGVTFGKLEGIPWAVSLPWEYVGRPGQLREKRDVEADYRTVLGMTKLAKSGAGGGHADWQNATVSRLTKAGLRKATEDRLVLSIKYIKTNRKDLFGDFDSYPADAQLCIMSIAWACGNAFNWPKFCAACKNKDWTTASNECSFKNPVRTQGARMKHQRTMMRNAAVVNRDGLDPTQLYWPRQLDPE